ncbi:hypothetical protein CALVIDRAFT_146997 [Calocera viscosa TUFC12733]|uniref:Dienelactone hydrolase domain-containing protein n=1 Tax=Calocera viscosa (strain TUFC12733) TaxID=1330018 RepID=A0A167LUF7_CALVF|nr:hypothetical protein CALVIDRAFT_146997 [Calocera viscosa TUFC12733]
MHFRLLCLAESGCLAGTPSASVAKAARAKGTRETVPAYEFKRYMGTRHGFGCRPALDLPVVKNAFEQAHEQALGWFRKTVL